MFGALVGKVAKMAGGGAKKADRFLNKYGRGAAGRKVRSEIGRRWGSGAKDSSGSNRTTRRY